MGLQELVGEHTVHGSQLEVLADQVWHNHAYGKNAVYSKGHHGNAILSKFPIISSKNIKISSNKFENRGFLYVQLNIPELNRELHLICTHLGLFNSWRKEQLDQICQFITKHSLQKEPLLLCGDFNDWNVYATNYLQRTLGLQEAYFHQHGRHARTYPSWLPLLPLDRIYYANLKLSSSKLMTGKVWQRLSDHIPMLAEFDF